MDHTKKTNHERIIHINSYLNALRNKEDGKLVYETYKNDLKCVTPDELMEVEYMQLEQGHSVNDVLDYVDKLINVVHSSLIDYKWERPTKGSFLYYLIKENEQVVIILDDIRSYVKTQKYQEQKNELLLLFEKLVMFDEHYQKKENILFPYLEGKMKRYNGLKIMWELHVKTRATLKWMIEHFKGAQIDKNQVNIAIGKLFFQINGLIQKEELILFPIASELLSSEEHEQMLIQSYEYQFPYIERPIKMIKKEIEKPLSQFTFQSETGSLNVEQLMLIFSHIPVDMTLIDEHDKVVYFNAPDRRLFKRSSAIIGRDVENCHPPKSVHVVKKILDSFRSGEKDSAEFWLTYMKRGILITYYALRNETGIYKGTLEISQDITDIKKIEGEKRLLDW